MNAGFKSAGAPLLKVELRALSKLKPFARNARIHSDAQVDQLVLSIEQFGFTVPVLIDEKGTILAGHGRVLAAEKSGRAHVPVLIAKGWSEEQKRAYVIADNRLAETASWDRRILGSEIGSLSLSGFDVSVLGFDESDIRELIALASRKEVDPDEVPPAPQVPVTQAGDLWLMGEHRLLCGDATSAKDVGLLLNGSIPQLMVTDPPYGVQYDPLWRGKIKKQDGKRWSSGIHASGKTTNDDRADWREAWALFPGNVAYVWHSGRHSTELGNSLAAAKFAIRSQIVWVKSHYAVGRGDYHWGHETAFYAVKGNPADDHFRFLEEHESAIYAVKMGETAHWRGGRKQSTVWNIDMVRNDTGHGAQKPVECMRRPILNNSKGGEAVYDPFLGSGTTLIAAQMEGRACLALEIDPSYCDIVCERWAKFTGLEPHLAMTQKSFSETRALRDGKKERRATGKATGGSARSRTRSKAGVGKEAAR